MLDSTDAQLRSFPCCKKSKCFKKANRNFLISKMSCILKLSSPQRRHTLQEMMGSTGSFNFYYGRRVCSNFLIKTFWFSHDFQASVKNSTKNVSHAKNNTNSRGDTVRDILHKDVVITFLDRVAGNTGDMMPGKKETHFPFFKISEVNDQFCVDYHKLHERNPPSDNYVFQMWKANCAHTKGLLE